MTRFSRAFVAGGSLVALALSCAMLSQSVVRRAPAGSRPQRVPDRIQTGHDRRDRAREGRPARDEPRRARLRRRGRRPSTGVGALHVGADAPQRGDRDRHERECSRRADAGDARRGSAIHRDRAATGRRGGARQLQPRGPRSSQAGPSIGLACGRAWTRSLRPAARRSTTRCSRPCRSSPRGASSARP